MKKIITTILVTTTLLTACKKEPVQTADCRMATVEFWGDPAADGLGWILVIDPITRIFESPDNLDVSYKVSGLQVHVCYVRTDEDLVCFCAQPFKKKVHITTISK